MNSRKERMFNAEDLIQTLNHRPFRPLQLGIRSGEVLTIAHPEEA